MVRVKEGGSVACVFARIEWVAESLSHVLLTL